MSDYVRKYLTLIKDPCGGELVSPPYAGTDAGYLVRTTDNLTITVTGAAMTVGPIVGSAVVDYTPNNYGDNLTTNSAWLGAAYGPGGTDPFSLSYANTTATSWSSGNRLNNFLSGGAVSRFRPVAACLKWIPTGAYNSRAGLVGVSYVPAANSNAASFSYAAAQSSCQHLSPNGSELHEVRWLPTAADETWSNPIVVATTPGCGTLRLVLRGVDGIATTATTGTLSGYVEVTTVWEWIPVAASNLTLNPRVPVPYTDRKSVV